MAVKEKIGIVVSDQMDKTVVVLVEKRYIHPIYGKTLKKNKRFMTHDDSNKCKIGDIVLIQETIPLSKKKRWTVTQIF
jgi:small subunit ribosomal protein S17|uniref:Small ribosomal subunit protein uS17c n=1 Tax=Octactis speculum TaxID=3111310 RepID=A0A514CPL5_9STRA|nr:ribosomal protein S17 [Dictyocha speculum]QDH81751.1 ribosomal protein S17 [Dictyocha speculum]|tara:strand:+ start:28449 stop:28682 length:234 start_codon:yes stop_codon:yes gene_type:complete